MIDWHPVLFGCSVSAMYIAPLCFLLFAHMDGRADALYFDRPVSPRQGPFWNPHTVFTLRRTGFMVLMLFSSGLVIALGCCLMFPAVHDNEYYDTRHDLDPSVYTDGARSEPSSTSTAILDLSYRIRMFMAAIGLLLMVTAYILA